jgi:hypothetical protein
MISDNNEQTNNKACQTLTSTSPKERPIPSVNECKVNNRIIIEILGITANQVVTIEGTLSYTSGDQLWNGAAPILNKKPTVIMIKPK